ncbi:MAG TPA: acyl-CoA desaturase [Kofleriaceae bacterium]
MKLAVMGAGVALCLAGIVRFGPLAAIGFVPICAVLCTSIAMVGHEGSHKSFSKSPSRNALIAYGCFPLFAGLSSLYWHNKHDRLHHGHPNVEGLDPDIMPFPFSSSRGDHERCGRKQRWFQRNLQRWVFWPMSTLMALGMRRSSLLYLARFEGKRGRAWRIEAACTLAHYVFWLVIPSLIFGPLATFLVYSAIWALVGVCLALVFAPAHMGMPVTRTQNHDWLHQIETTRNLELPRFISFFFIGLDYQVEHHIFPKIAHAQLPRAAEITRAWCARQGIPYLSQPYTVALVDAMQFMASAWAREAECPHAVRSWLVQELAA